MNVLVTGACGLLGSHLMVALSPSHDVTGIDRHPWWGDQPANILVNELQEPGSIEHAVDSTSPDVLIHCAALANVDVCEQDSARAYACNADLTRRLARAAPPGCFFVYITTDGIFKGDTPFATEDLQPSPRTVYGRSKLRGEWHVREATENHLIIRTNFYGWSSGRKQTSAEWLYGALERGEAITLFDDFFFTPIYVVDFVVRLGLLIEGGHHGTFHLCGRERVSKYEFGSLMAKAAGLSMRSVRRGSLDEIPLAASRPKDMSLSSEHFRRVMSVELPDCIDGLRRFLKDGERSLSARFDGARENLERVPGLAKAARASE